MKRLITLALLTGMLFTLAACGSKPQSTPTPNPSTGSTSSTEEYQYPEMTIKLAHDTSSATPVHESSERIKEEIERVSGGRIKVDIYPQQQLGSAREMIEGMQMNSIELVLLPTSKYGGFDQTLNMLDLPFLFPTEESTIKLFESDLAEKLMAKLENISIHGIAFYNGGSKNFTNNKPIHLPEDFKGMKIRVQEAPIIMKMYQSWDAVPVAIDISELYNALQQKTVDGQENPFLSISSRKLYEVQNYMIVSRHSYLHYIVCSSKQWWDGLDEPTRTLIEDTILKNQRFCYDRLQEYNSEYLADIEAGNIEIYELTEEEHNAFVQASMPVYDTFGAEIGADLIKEVQDFLAKPENQ
jgi:tripartite ATP-independent transporter DctP family solute receptor